MSDFGWGGAEESERGSCEPATSEQINWVLIQQDRSEVHAEEVRPMIKFNII